MGFADILRVTANVIEWALPLIPDEEIRNHLTETHKKLIDKMVDLAEAAKFGP